MNVGVGVVAWVWAWQLAVTSNLAVANEANLKSLNRSA